MLHLFFFLFPSLSLSMKVTLSLSSSSSILPQQQHSSPHLCYMGFSSDDDLDTGHIQLQLVDESIEEAEHMNRGVMDFHPHQQQQNHGVEFEFWPLEHPMEPLDEDRPVKCPMEESSVINDGGMVKEQHGESSWRRRTHHHSAPAATRRGRGGGGMDTQAAAPPPRAVRKRQHTLTGGTGDHILTPLMRMPTLPPLQAQNLTIFQMLQQLDKFEP